MFLQGWGKAWQDHIMKTSFEKTVLYRVLKA